jgi:hypothetical protein
VNSTSVYADAGDSDAADSNPDIQTGSYADTAAVDGTNYIIGDNDAPDIWILLNFTVPTYATIEGFNYSTYAWGESVNYPVDNDTLEFWNFDTSAWVEIGELSDGSLGWLNGTIYDSDYWSDVIMFRYYAYGIAASDARLEVDYAGLEFYYSPLPQWSDVGEATLWFHVPMHPWGLNALLILLGMCLVVCSGVYLAKGGKNEISSDKVFYALVMFMLGWGLIVGGILP